LFHTLRPRSRLSSVHSDQH